MLHAYPIADDMYTQSNWLVGKCNFSCVQVFPATSLHTHAECTLILTLKACPHLIPIRSTSISHLNHHFVRTGLQLDLHFDPVRTTSLTRDDSYARPNSNYHHVIAYLPLAVTQSCFWISHPAGFGHCLLPIHTTTRSFLVQSDNRSTSSTNMCFN